MKRIISNQIRRSFIFSVIRDFNAYVLDHAFE